MSQSIYEVISSQILERMETCGRDWVPSWNGATAIPSNFVTGKRYRGINVLALWMAQIKGGYVHNQWASFKQYKYNTPGCVRKGEKGTMIAFFDRYDKNAGKSDEADWRTVLKHSYVFNVEQVQGLELPEPNVDPAYYADEREQAMDEFISQTKATIKAADGMHPCYSPAADLVMMPAVANYDDPIFWYHDCFHELGHWTGHKSRLNRRETIAKRIKGHQYAAEELVAELTAAFVGAEFELSSKTSDDTAKYINNWITMIKEDNRAFSNAARMAAEATDYLFKRGQYDINQPNDQADGTLRNRAPSQVDDYPALTASGL